MKQLPGRRKCQHRGWRIQTYDREFRGPRRKRNAGDVNPFLNHNDYYRRGSCAGSLRTVPVGPNFGIASACATGGDADWIGL